MKIIYAQAVKIPYRQQGMLLTSAPTMINGHYVLSARPIAYITSLKLTATAGGESSHFSFPGEETGAQIVSCFRSQNR